MSSSIKTVPRHIAIIMDGNGRWAKSRGLSRIKGHEAGAQAVRECVEGCGELKVEYLTLYAFSAENWQRPRAEIIALMRLLEKFLREKTPELLEKNVRLQAIGRLTDLPRDRKSTKALPWPKHGLANPRLVQTWPRASAHQTARP